MGTSKAGLVALVIVVVLCLTAGADGKKRKKEAVTITYQDYCLSCIVTIEEFARQVHEELDKMNIKVAPPGMARQVDGNKLIDRLCDSKVFLDYRPALRHGCLKLTTEHLAETLGGMDGAHTEANWTEVRVHTQEACVAVDACKPGAPLLFNQYEPTDDCNACRALVSDVEHLLMREKDENQKDKARVAGIIDSMCYDLGMRAEYSPKDLEYMTEICEELVDDVGARSIAGTIMLRNRLSRSGMRPTGTLADKVCGEMGGFCEDTSEEGDDADEEL